MRLKLSKRSHHVALQIIICLTIILPVIGILSGCTLVINSENVNTEVVPAVSAVELAL